jgi:hypothetical protein
VLDLPEIKWRQVFQAHHPRMMLVLHVLVLDLNMLLLHLLLHLVLFVLQLLLLHGVEFFFEAVANGLARHTSKVVHDLAVGRLELLLLLLDALDEGLFVHGDAVLFLEFI